MYVKGLLVSFQTDENRIKIKNSNNKRRLEQQKRVYNHTEARRITVNRKVRDASSASQQLLGCAVVEKIVRH